MKTMKKALCWMTVVCLLLASAGVPIEAFGAAMACLQSAIEEEQPFHTGEETP